jgi:hypothetical protein
VCFLQAPLEAARFRVLVLTASLKKMRDPQIAVTLTHRLFVTNNAQEYHLFAAEQESSIIDTSKVGSDPKTFATMISEAWMRLELRGKLPLFCDRCPAGGTRDAH